MSEIESPRSIPDIVGPLREADPAPAAVRARARERLLTAVAGHAGRGGQGGPGGPSGPAVVGSGWARKVAPVC